MGTLLNPTCDSIKGDLIERVYIPKGPPNPNSHIVGHDCSEGLAAARHPSVL